MTDERWQLAYAIYEAAAPLAKPERKQYVHAAAPDAEIAGKVLAMLDEMEATAGSGAFPEPAYSEDAAAASVPLMALSPGATIGSYQVVDRLGSGGMGEVYLAHDPRLDRRVAIKLLPAHLAADAVARKRLRREALAAAALDHPFICKIFEIGEDQGTLFIVMEYISGETLYARLRAGPLPQSDALRIAGEVAEALEAAHARPLVHRDLKPANVMLTAQGRAKVMDFGLAKRPASDELKDVGATAGDLSLTTQGAVAGTPEYMSPEQVKGAPLDHRSDLFSFGIILCELLTGKHPFQRNSKLETMTAILRDQPDLAVKGGAGLSPGQMVLIRRLLAKSPDERYQSMREVREDLARLASSSAVTFEPEEAATPSIPLIGRDPERAELVRHLESALAGRGSLVLIGGEPGIGKTHLTRAILAEAARRGCYTAVGHCYEMEGAPPYVPFIEMLEYAARVVPRESFRYALGTAAPEVAKLMPELRHMFPDIPPPLELPPEQQRRFLFNAYREYLERAARAAPIVRVFEDLHWGDEPTLLLLQHLAQTVATVPMLMIGTYRDVELDVTRPFARVLESLIREKLASRMTLRRLPMAGVEALLAALSGQTPPPSLARVVFAETEGNPFFVEELFRHLAEEGKLFDEKGVWRPGLRVDQLQVPEGVRLVLGRRLERLGGEARRVLTTAAVIGRSFSLRLLEDLENARSTTGVDVALEAVEEAERAHLIVPEHAGRETRYSFMHELVRHTLAETLSLPRRQRLHARVADAVERLYASNLDNQVPVLAHHLYQAGAAVDPDKTIKYLMAAAQLASTGAAHEEALAHLDNALSLIEDDRDAHAAELHVGRAVALRSLGRLAEAVDSYERAIALFTEARDVRAAAEASFRLAAIHGWKADGQRALSVLDRALRLLGAEISSLRHRLLISKAWVLTAFVNTEAGVSALAEAKSLGRSLPEAGADGYCSMYEARVHWHAAQLGQTDECAREAIARFRAAGDLWGEADFWEPVGVALCTGRPTEAEGLIRDSVARAERVGNHTVIWLCKRFSAEMHLAAGNLERAERAAHESLDLAQSVLAGSRWLFLDFSLLGIIAHYRGRLDEAALWSRRALEVGFQGHWSALLAGGLFWSLAAQGDPVAANALAGAYPLLPLPARPLSMGACGCLGLIVEGLAWLGRREELAALQPHAEHVVANGPWCVYSQQLFRTAAGIAAASARNWSRAEEHHQAAIHQADTAPYRVAQPIARYWYAEMLLERGAPADRARAHNLLGEALATFESLGMPVYARRASEKLASLNP